LKDKNLLIVSNKGWRKKKKKCQNQLKKSMLGRNEKDIEKRNKLKHN